MIIKVYNEWHDYLLFIDLEFNNRDLVQFAGLLFKKIDNDGTYQLASSINQYITTRVCYPFMEYTHISNSFLESNGIPLKDAQILIANDFLNNVNLDRLLLVSHGLKNDRSVLKENGINLLKRDGTPVDGYCTFNNGKRILKRNHHLHLSDIAHENGYFLSMAHNAFQDAWAEVAVFTVLKKLEAQEGVKQLNETIRPE